ncbi:MAG: DNA-binding protein [bacterium]|nr:DNA-binding protein [bacterium]
METYAFRLIHGQDLRQEIDRFVKKKQIAAGVVLTCVGNLKKAIIRMANGKTVKTYEGTFEIVSLVGTLENGNSHLHISISDAEGSTFGGHLKQGSIVGITAEIVIGELDGLKFRRALDPSTGFDELVVE